MNTVAFTGRLATPVTVETYPGKDSAPAKTKAAFLLAVPKRKRDALQPDWIAVECWGRDAEVCREFLTKGVRVTVRGRLSGRFIVSKATDRRRLRMTVVAEEVVFGSGCDLALRPLTE